jgi:hypothetical protein
MCLTPRVGFKGVLSQALQHEDTPDAKRLLLGTYLA